MRDVVLVIDGGDFERRRLCRVLVEAGYDVYEARNAVEGFTQAFERDIDLIILAEELPPLTAGDLVPMLRRFSTVPVIVVGNGEESDIVEALELGADFYIDRPVKEPELLARARALIRRRRGSAYLHNPELRIARAA